MKKPDHLNKNPMVEEFMQLCLGHDSKPCYWIQFEPNVLMYCDWWRSVLHAEGKQIFGLQRGKRK